MTSPNNCTKLLTTLALMLTICVYLTEQVRGQTESTNGAKASSAILGPTKTVDDKQKKTDTAVQPLSNAHSHNDYYRKRPLDLALENGFCSVEADVFLRNETLLVAHSIFEIRKGVTLEKLYLDPLLKRFRDNDGTIFRDKEAELLLLIDFKDKGSATYAALKKSLVNYKEMLTHVKAGKVQKGAVKIVISGARPVEEITAEQNRLVFLDGRIGDLRGEVSSTIVPLISESWRSHFKYSGRREMSKEEIEKLRKIVKTAHMQNKRVRFWASPDKEASWKIQLEAGVDLINTDKIAELAKFLRSAENK